MFSTLNYIFKSGIKSNNYYFVIKNSLPTSSLASNLHLTPDQPSGFTTMPKFAQEVLDFQAKSRLGQP